ncbi:MAG: alpha/beta fold hydrolase [Flavisolibacter sp.]
MKVYFLAGIAADGRLFKHIKLPPGYEAIFINWIKPLENEKIDEYAKRLTYNINTEEKFILVGLSLGGIVATEIAKLHQPEATIILGSVTTSNQLPPYYKWLHKLKVNKIIPGSFYKWASGIKHRLTKESKEDKALLINMIRNADPDFIFWGTNAVPEWNNSISPSPLYHIHGTRDEIFPIKFVKPTHVIKKGGHLLALSHYNEVNIILRDILERQIK